MKYTEPGEYTLVYKATDERGNITEQIRDVVVEPADRLILRHNSVTIGSLPPNEYTEITPFSIVNEPYSGAVRVSIIGVVLDGVSYGSFSTVGTVNVAGGFYSFDEDIPIIEESGKIFSIGGSNGSGKITYLKYTGSDETAELSWDSIQISERTM